MNNTITSSIINRIYELQMEYDSRDGTEEECYTGEILARMDECNQILAQINILTPIS